jgi:hypothetical protein
MGLAVPTLIDIIYHPDRSAVDANLSSPAAADGSAEFKPRGRTGTITMKMMSTTSRTSISGAYVDLTGEAIASGGSGR